MTYEAVSLFTGAGGMDVGFQEAGYEIVWANDLNRDACLTYEENHPSTIHHGDLNEFLPKLKAFSGIQLVFGGPPCQGFSVAGKMDPSDNRSKLIWSFAKTIKIIRPTAFVMENVKALGTISRWAKVRSDLIDYFEKLEYDTELLILNSCEFGVPQIRERMFLVGIKRQMHKEKSILPFLNRYRAKANTVEEVIKALGPAGSSTNTRVCKAKVTLALNPVLRRSPYAGMLFNGQGRPLNPLGFCSTLPASMGGNRTPIIDEGQIFANLPSWVEEYHAHLVTGGKPYNSDTVPACLRRLTIDECIQLQTFPNNYNFIGKQNSVYRQIGNAVPPKLAFAVASALRDRLECVRSN